MKVRFPKAKTPKKISFNDLAVGTVFTYDGDNLYMKVDKYYNNGGNLVCLSTGKPYIESTAMVTVVNGAFVVEE